MLFKSFLLVVSLVGFCKLLTGADALASCGPSTPCLPVDNVTYLCDAYDNKCRPTKSASCGNENGTCCKPGVLAQKYICTGRLVCSTTAQQPNTSSCVDFVKTFNVTALCTVRTSLSYCLSDLDCAANQVCESDNTCRAIHLPSCGGNATVCCPQGLLANDQTCEGTLSCNDNENCMASM